MTNRLMEELLELQHKWYSKLYRYHVVRANICLDRGSSIRCGKRFNYHINKATQYEERCRVLVTQIFAIEGSV